MYTLHFRLLVLREVRMSSANKVLEFRSQIELPHFTICTTCGSSFRSTYKRSFPKKVTGTEIRAVTARRRSQLSEGLSFKAYE